MMTREDPMKRRKATGLERLRRRIARLDAHSIDRLYGLEPVWEPGAAAAHVAPELFGAGRCPYCGERLEKGVDLPADKSGSGEGFWGCCPPIEFQTDGGSGRALSGVQGKTRA